MIMFWTKQSSTVVLALLLAILTSCARVSVANTDSQQVQVTGSLNGHPIEHVVIVAIDGLKRDTLLQYLMKTPPQRGGLHDLLGVEREGDGVVLTRAIAVQQAATVFPSYTYPAWTSMFTGVFPGTHSITGNSLFFRDRHVARYYTEYHLDAVRVLLEKDFLSNDMNEHIKTMYEYVREQGGRSIVVHNMVTRGSEARKPDFDTLWSYKSNRSYAVDENSLWEAVKSLKDFNKDNSAELRLPTILTMYFSGLDHAEHLSPVDPEQARLTYLGHLDSLIAKFISGDQTIARNHYQTPESRSTQADVMAWGGLGRESVWGRTLFLLVSDHGHTPIQWNDALGVEDLRLIFQELSERSGRPYQLEHPSLVDETVLSKVRAALGLFDQGHISQSANVVATLNGGALGFHIKPEAGQWDQRPDYLRDVKPILEHLLLTLHQNEQGPEAVLYNTGTRYVVIPYEYTGSAIQLLPAVEVHRSPLDSPRYPMAVQRLDGLASRMPTDPLSAPDLILLADRSKKLTYLNKQDGRVLEKLNVETHRHFHSDHGHLQASDSLVPMIFGIGGYIGEKPLATICEASLVDVTPTVLEVLGILPSFEKTLQRYPNEVKGRSLKKLMELILNRSDNHEDMCSAHMTTND